MKTYLRTTRVINANLVTIEKFIPNPPIVLGGTVKLKINDRYIQIQYPEYIVEETFAFMVYRIFWPHQNGIAITLEILKNEGWYEIDNEPWPEPIHAPAAAIHVIYGNGMGGGGAGPPGHFGGYYGGVGGGGAAR